MTAPLSLVWCAPIYEASGYADEARGLLTALELQHLPVVLRPVLERQIPGFREQLSPAVAAALSAQEQRAPTSPYLLVEHFLADGFVSAPGAAAVVGRTMFETDALPTGWVARCNTLDALWVPSRFNVESFRRAGVRVPIHIVPGGIDCTQYTPDGPALAIPGARGTVFLSVFEWRRRKGWDVLLRAWSKAFSATDDVSLVLRTFVPGQSATTNSASNIDRTINDFLATECGTSREQIAPIVVYPDLVPESSMPALYRAAHAYVSPTRGEGWGRPFMEAMATALPVITTRWSAHLDYMNDANSLLIDIEGLVPAIDPELTVYRGTSWAEPSVAHLVTLLRSIVADPAAARTLGARARDDMSARWSWSRAADAVVEGIRAINVALADSQKQQQELLERRLQPTVRVVAPIFDELTAPITLERLATPLQRALVTHGVALRFDGSVADPRPPLGSAREPFWHDRMLGEDSPASSTNGVTITWCTPEALTSIVAPSTGAWIVCTDECVIDELPDSFAALIRARADDVWVPHASAAAAIKSVGVDATRIYELPEMRVIDAESVAALRSGAGRALRTRRTVLLPVASLVDVAVAELVVRLWPRVRGDDADLAIRIRRQADSAVFAWAESLIQRLHTTRGLESISVWSEDFAPMARAAVLRTADILLLPSNSAVSLAWWTSARDLELAVIAPLHAHTSRWPDDAVTRVPLGPAGTMSGSALGEALKRLCTTDALVACREAMRRAAAQTISPDASAERLAERVAERLALVRSRARTGAP